MPKFSSFTESIEDWNKTAFEDNVRLAVQNDPSLTREDAEDIVRERALAPIAPGTGAGNFACFSAMPQGGSTLDDLCNSFKE
ncbi:TPA: hypothetical protein DEA21_04260 [Candidatus Uhrbacteria bacterium]|nr:hypothetical protein [Candidatus Uhrbacteria bacterium]